MATVANDADELQRQMAQIRHELHQNVREVVVQAEAVADWRRYIRFYPWVSVGVAFAVGYLVVPKRHPSVPRPVATTADVAEVRAAVQETRRDEPLKAMTKQGLLAAAWATVGPVAIRLAQGYAAQYLESRLLQQQPPTAAAAPPPPRQPSEPGWSGGTRGR